MSDGLDESSLATQEFANVKQGQFDQRINAMSSFNYFVTKKAKLSVVSE